ncbi:hypothetical protein [Corynebacterium lactis]|uniref:hypothetical protein n=1 Tax=Corynebacterium lactis TaxID=1231000 RepID=UPI0012E1598C|nr:hypothetical protein [Corynebacterium lactis]
MESPVHQWLIALESQCGWGAYEGQGIGKSEFGAAFAAVPTNAAQLIHLMSSSCRFMVLRHLIEPSALTRSTPLLHALFLPLRHARSPFAMSTGAHMLLEQQIPLRPLPQSFFHTEEHSSAMYDLHVPIWVRRCIKGKPMPQWCARPPDRKTAIPTNPFAWHFSSSFSLLSAA